MTRHKFTIKPLHWAVVLVILSAATAVALWPREGATTQPVSTQPAPNLAALQAKAKLLPCPTPDGSAGAGPTALQGITVPCLADNSPVDLAAITAHRIVLVNFWASWCPPCRDELSVVNSYAAQPGAVLVLTVQVPDHSTAADGLELLASLGVHVPTVLDSDQALSKAFHKPSYFPASYVIAIDGTITPVSTPAVFHSVDEVRQAIARYANPSAAAPDDPWATS